MSPLNIRHLNCNLDRNITRDVDLVIETRHVETLDEKKRTLFQLRDRLRNDGIATATQVNARARVPVLSFVSTPESGNQLSFKTTGCPNIYPR